MATIHPLVIQQWLVQELLNEDTGFDARMASKGYVGRIEGRVYPRKQAPRAVENADQELWPFIAYAAPSSHDFDQVFNTPLLKDGLYLISFVQWYAALSSGLALDEFCAQGQEVLQEMFSGEPNFEAPNGVIHGMDIIGEVGPLVSGDEDFTTCEAGYQVRFWAN